MSANAGIPASLPLLIISVTLASLTFFLLASVALLNRPFRPGPIFFSSLSALWQTAQLASNVSLPLATSPGLVAASALIPAINRLTQAATEMTLFILIVYN